ncbi:CMGC kinase, MAPK family, putative [Eimeria necatrix]|uniref:Mitogen-activated protein kinase n=1 Tax=Eimeria necatrix TaxID=51315 RepID=U6N3H6_9EIME|nr:CMGC kinase, MAPK family, putative [Eimeria necatrix]CDJ69294.1 CMGC kinase, MAPK family, putative [Eimeria necatrix]
MSFQKSQGAVSAAPAAALEQGYVQCAPHAPYQKLQQQQHQYARYPHPQQQQQQQQQRFEPHPQHVYYQQQCHAGAPNAAAAKQPQAAANAASCGSVQQPQRCVQQQQQQQQQHRHPEQDHQRKNQQHAVKPTRMPHPLADWQLPERYEVHHLIGTGSYGHVCEVYDNQEQRIVAIKKIHRVFEDLIDCKRILREIAILNRLNHDHIVKILDILVPSDLEKFDEMYVVLEIADSDFKKLFRAPVYLTELHIKTLLYNLLVGVKYVHSAGILHRDLKPANCLVNQDCSVKVCDFGLARTMDFPEGHNSHCPVAQQDDDIVNVTHTKNLKRQLTGHVVTRWYRAPELILLAENYTEAIDVWSIGCIFSELLSMIVTATEKVRLPFNDWANMDEPQLRLGFLREMQRFHPELQLPKSLLERAKMCS